MFKHSSKINKIRTFALALVFVGVIVMYLGLYFQKHYLVMTLLMLLGFLFTLLSAGIYLWVGMLSTKAVVVRCPSCGKATKVLGRVDACMSCNQPLTLDPELEGKKELNRKYNRRSYAKKG